MVDRQRATAGQVTVFSRVGNLGCIRFPPPIRKISGIKRDDRLVVKVIDTSAIRINKPSDDGSSAAPLGTTFVVKKCECDIKPDGCSETVTVGWSYIQLSAALAQKLKFLPNRPIELTAVTNSVTVRVRRDSGRMKTIDPVICPP